MRRGESTVKSPKKNTKKEKLSESLELWGRKKKRESWGKVRNT